MSGDWPLRLRQVCLITSDLDRAMDDIVDVLGLSPCHRDANVANYGLENVLFPVGDCFLEIVAPVRDGTAAGRFLERTAGRGGYMAIFECPDPIARGARAEAMGVPIANRIVHGTYTGIQLHPVQCRGAMIEFDINPGGPDLSGEYYPAGGNGWHEARRTDVTRSLLALQLVSSDPHGLAAHWGQILDLPLATQDGVPVLRPDLLPIEVHAAPAGTRERIDGLLLDAIDPAASRSRASRRGLSVTGAAIDICGVTIRFSSDASR